MPPIVGVSSDEPVHTQVIDGDMVLVIDGTKSGEAVYALVSSKSQIGDWHRVRSYYEAQTTDRPDHLGGMYLLRCTCRGFAVRGSCRHIDEVKQALNEPQELSAETHLHLVADHQRRSIR
jgi:hypothetical protein